MKNLSKLFSKGCIALSVLSAMTLASCGNNNNGGSDTVKAKIGVAFVQMGDEQTAQKDYLTNYVAKELNAEFVFSEKLESVDKVLEFVENCQLNGCNAIMNFQNDSVDSVISKCDELGMYVVSNTSLSKMSDESLTKEHNLGAIGIAASDVAEQYKNMVESFTSDGKSHNFFISSAGAAKFNAQHIDCTVAMLDAIKSQYNLTYTDGENTTTLAMAKDGNPREISTGNSNVHVYLYPGYINSDNAAGMQNALNGDIQYDVVLCCNQAYKFLTTTIDSIEKAKGYNIKLGAFDSIGESAYTVFNTKDSTGDSVMNSMVIKPATSMVGTMYSVLYNGLNGKTADMKVDGKAVEYDASMWICNSTAEYNAVSKINTEEKYYEFVKSDIEEMTKSDATAASIQAFIKKYTLSYLLQQRGLQ